ncbi:MAG: hypothetical protein KKC50_08275 [Candidatus Omnitrophica bacterium]|nr:hypothetical protein [Candidatus Omnitrophota bacterium]
MSEEINIPEKSQSLKTDIEDCYRSSVMYLQRYKSAQRKHVGNEKLYFTEFVGAFESLYIFTSVDLGIQKELLQDGHGQLLVNRVSKWLENGNTNPKEGEQLFLAYRKALFDRGILSFKK